jgi:hypothetical protein
MEKDFNDMSYAEQRSWLMDKAFPKKDPNASLSWIEEGKLKNQSGIPQGKANSKDPTKATTKENSPAKDAGGRQELQALKGININL